MSQESPEPTVAVHEAALQQSNERPEEGHSTLPTAADPALFMDSPISDSGDIGFEQSNDGSPLGEDILQSEPQNPDAAMETQAQSGDIVIVDELACGKSARGTMKIGKENPPRTISVTSDELLMVGEMDDFEHFEVLDTTGEIDPPPPHHALEDKGHRDQHSITGEDSASEGSADPKDSSHDDIEENELADTSEEAEGHTPNKEDNEKDKQDKRAISPIVFDKSDRSTKRDKSNSSSSKSKDKHKDHQHSGPHRVVDKLFSNTRYFVIKSNNFENIHIAKDKSVWSTPPYNEKKLNKAYRDCRNVLLIFSVRESGRFQGIARLASDARHDVPHVPWVLPPGISQAQLGGVFKLDWLHKGTLEFSVCMELKNPWNDNKPVKISRDGQEIEPTVGEKLCRLWQKIESDDDVLVGQQHPSSSQSSLNRDRHQHSSGSGPSSQAPPHFSQHRHLPHSLPSYPNPYVAAAYGYAPHPMGHLFPGAGDARSRLPMPPPSLYHQPSKQHMSEAEALLDSRKKRPEGATSSSSSSGHKSSSASRKSYHRHVESSGPSRSSSSSTHHRSDGGDRGGGGGSSSGGGGHEVYRTSDRERRVERSYHGGRGASSGGGGGGGERRGRHVTRKSEKEKRKRSRSRSGSGSSFEEDFGVRKETLLHGTYADYIKEYSRSKAPSGPPQSVADIATAYHKALSKVATALAQQGEPKMSPKAYSQKVEEFLAKTRNGQPMGSK